MIEKVLGFETDFKVINKTVQPQEFSAAKSTLF